jgi:hypothetical protein
VPAHAIADALRQIEREAAQLASRSAVQVDSDHAALGRAIAHVGASALAAEPACAS